MVRAWGARLSSCKERGISREDTTESRGLLEREAEVTAIEEAIDAAAEGRGGALFLVGEAGLGKTSLLAAAAEHGLERGMRVLRARGEELERDFPWGVALQLFAPVAHGPEADELFTGAAGLARELLEGAAPPPGSDADTFPLLHGLHWLTAGLCERAPLLILVDDAHWADAETLRYLAYLLARIEELAACVIVTQRSGEPLDPDSAELLAGLRSHASAGTRVLRPLGPQAVARVARTELPGAGARLCAAIEEAGGGNPFLTRELARAAREEGIDPSGEAERLRELRPEAIRNSILVRLARLGDDAAKLAIAAAILGPRAPLRIARRLAGLDEAAGIEAASALVSAGILAGTDQLSFAHPIVRDVVYGDLTPPRRASRHAVAARLLRDAGAAPEDVAAHLMSADMVTEPWATSALREAAARAAARGALGSAARFLARASSASSADDPTLLLELGAVEAGLGDPAAVAHLEAAARTAIDSTQRGAILGKLAAARYAGGDTEGVITATRTALAEIPPGGGGSIEAELLFNYGMTGRAVPTLVEDVMRLLELPRLGPDGEPTASEVVRMMLVGFDAMLRGDHRSADERLREPAAHLADERLSRDVPSLAQITREEFRAILGDTGGAERAAEEHLERARRRGNRLEAAIALEARAAARWFGGDLPGALGDAEVALSLTGEVWGAATAVVRVIKGLALIEQGDVDGAELSLSIPEELEAQLPGSWGWFLLPGARARLALARGDWSQAREEALTARERLLSIEAPTAGFVGWRPLAAEAAARLGAREEAIALAREELELARAGGAAPATVGIALATVGVVEGGEEGVEALREAADLLEDSPNALEHSRALIDCGAALRRAGWDRDARERLRLGLERARACEAGTLVERAVEELAAAGARPRRAALSGVESLTPSERRVAEMAAQGLSNREIAEALFVTRRTVETHLTHAYAKLGIASRAELRKAMSGGRAGAPRSAP